MMLMMRSSSIRCATRTLSTAPSNGPDQILPASDFVSWSPEVPVKLRLQDSGPQSVAPKSIPTLFNQTVEKLPNNIALGVKGKNGENLTWTYSQYLEDVLNVSRGLIALGVEPFSSVCILGNNSPQWAIANFAAIHAGALPTGLYQTNSAEACRFIAHHSRASLIVLDEPTQLDKIRTIRHKLPNLKAIVQFGADQGTDGVISWTDLIKLGKSESDAHLRQRLASMAVNQCACLVYTSGTTGNPKGAMLSHDSMTLNSTASPLGLYGWRYGEERLVSYLPLSHLAGMTMDLYWALGTGAATMFADKNALKGSLVENLQHFKPTRFVGVPRVWQKIEERIKLAGRNTSGLRRKVIDWAKAEAERYHLERNSGCEGSRWQYRLASRHILPRVHQALGLGDIAKPIEMGTGSAVLSADTHKFFYSLDMRLLELYACTETGGLAQTTSLPGAGNCRLGTVGRQPTGLMETKILSPDENGAGEICSRSRGLFMGYAFDKEKTIQSVDSNGWLHSGDIGVKDQDGFFKIIGRQKEIIITAGGKNIPPVNIEDEIKTSLPNLISNVMVVGEGRSYLTCLLTLKVEDDPVTNMPSNKLDVQVMGVLTGLGISGVTTVEELLLSDKLLLLEAVIDKGIENANSNASSNAAKVRKWRLLPQDFSVLGGELSSSLKLKRFYVTEKYSRIIDEMYIQ